MFLTMVMAEFVIAMGISTYLQHLGLRYVLLVLTLFVVQSEYWVDL
jgi:hypothetical protein